MFFYNDHFQNQKEKKMKIAYGVSFTRLSQLAHFASYMVNLSSIHGEEKESGEWVRCPGPQCPLCDELPGAWTGCSTSLYLQTVLGSRQVLCLQQCRAQEILSDCSPPLMLLSEDLFFVRKSDSAVKDKELNYRLRSSPACLLTFPSSNWNWNWLTQWDDFFRNTKETCWLYWEIC